MFEGDKFRGKFKLALFKSMNMFVLSSVQDCQGKPVHISLPVQRRDLQLLHQDGQPDSLVRHGDGDQRGGEDQQVGGLSR